MTHLDGNAVAGAFADLLSFDVTTALARCAGCGSVAPMAMAMVYRSDVGTGVRAATRRWRRSSRRTAGFGSASAGSPRSRSGGSDVSSDAYAGCSLQRQRARRRMMRLTSPRTARPGPLYAANVSGK